MTERREDLIAKLREPVDCGGYDGFGPDGLHIAAADAIEAERMRADTAMTLLAAWQKRAYEAEKQLGDTLWGDEQQEVKAPKVRPAPQSSVPPVVLPEEEQKDQGSQWYSRTSGTAESEASPLQPDNAEIWALALEYHKTVEGEYGRPGVECPGVKRLHAFALRVLAGAPYEDQTEDR